MSRLTLLLGALLLCVVPAEARREPRICGTHELKARQEHRLHATSLRSGIKRQRATTAAVVRPDIGDVAVIDDSDGVISRRNPFTMGQRTLRFAPASQAARSYRFTAGADSFDSTVLAAGRKMTLADDATVLVSLPFPFPFFGKTYNELYVNSDGNVSFGSGDPGVTDRSLGRFLASAPRIAALFTDLDPSRTAGEGGIYTTAGNGTFTITWLQVPEYSDFGTGRRQTFQIRLFASGAIEIAWSDVQIAEAVVGLSTGALQSELTLVSFGTTVSGEYSGTLAEFFTSSETVDIFAAAQRFYRNHEDSYDYLVFFNNLGIQADPGSAVAYEVTVRNDRSGFGDRQTNVGSEAGSGRRLQALINMGTFDDYPGDPDGQVALRLPSPDTPKTVMAHEAGHLFLAYASVRDDEGPTEFPMVGHQGAHWSLTFNSEASLLEGERIRDNGAGANPRFTTVAAVEGFSPLDQYLMGFRAAEEVPDTFYVAAASSTAPRYLPQVGVGFNGQRRDVRIADVIAEVGRRVPDYTVSQRRFRFAFVLITGSGREVPAEDLARMERYRQAFEQFYSRAASGRAVADASLKRALAVSAWPATGVAAGASGVPVRIETEAPVSTNLTLLVRNSAGVAEASAVSVTIPAGQSVTTFTLRGVRAGAETIVVEPADPRYETGEFKGGVTDGPARVLQVVSGNGQAAIGGVVLRDAIRVRLTDANGLPYPGVEMSASVAGGGSVDAASRITDPAGYAEFRWTPGTQGAQVLSISAPGIPAPAVVTALSRPAVSAGGVVNAASFTAGVVPGGIATVFGASLGSEVNSTQVLVNGLAAQVFYASTGQINFLVPQNVVPGSTAELVIANVAGRSEIVRAPVQEVQPGIFFDPPTGYGAITLAGTGQVTQVLPARRGEVVEIYATGLGGTSATSGGLQATRVMPTVTIGGSTAEVLFSGLAPGFPGLYQVNARIPAGIGTGTQVVTMTAGGQRSNDVRIEVR